MADDTKPGGQDDTKPAGETKPEDKAASDTTKADDQKPAADKGKTQDDTKPDDKGGKDGKPADDGKPKAPEKYELKIPDGGRLTDADRQYVETLAKEGGLSNDDAQALLDTLDERLAAQAATWLTETQADKEYGGAKLEQTQSLARRVIDRVRPAGHARRDAFLGFLNRGGAGNQIEVIAFLADLGKLMAEDTTSGQHMTTTPPKAERSAADVLYGKT